VYTNLQHNSRKMSGLKREMKRLDYSQKMKERKRQGKNLLKYHKFCGHSQQFPITSDQGSPNLLAIKCLGRGECFYHGWQGQEHGRLARAASTF